LASDETPKLSTYDPQVLVKLRQVEDAVGEFTRMVESATGTTLEHHIDDVWRAIQDLREVIDGEALSHAVAAVVELTTENESLRSERSTLHAWLAEADEERDQLAALLYVLRYDLHPTYANTARRGRGIGGQAMTPQCNVLDPEGWEERALTAVDDALNQRARRLTRDGSSRWGVLISQVRAFLKRTETTPQESENDH
jgi:uncharacterized protein YqgV (UPF0045/DUF77 family)